MIKQKTKTLYISFLLILTLFTILTLVTGDTSWDIVWDGIKDRLTEQTSKWNPLLDERLPRLLVVICTGASLATSGTVMQALFHNPLVSPGVLGISSGGSLAALIIFIIGWHVDYPYAIPIAAFSGCLITMLFIYFLASYYPSDQLNTIILTGIAISVLMIAIQSALIYALRDRWQLIQVITEWEAGSTADRTWYHVHMQLPLTLVGLFGCFAYRSEINILALGEEEAKNLGVEVEKVRWRLFLCVALLTGGAIAAVGIIAFFGLVLPHLLRKLQGPDNRTLVPLSILGGGTILLGMDLVLRLCKIHAFSIGNISAILGGIFFLVILFEKRSLAND